jgi:hypothetical protein
MTVVQYQKWLSIMVAVLAVYACSIINPVSKAETTEQRAYAAYGTFVIFEEKAVELVESGTLPDDIALAIIDADERAKGVADSLLDATWEFIKVRDQLAAGETTQEQLDIAVANLDSWINRAVPLINGLGTAVTGAN